MTTINISVSDLVSLVVASTNELDTEEQDSVIQNMTTKLNEWYIVPLIELSQIMLSLGIPIQRRCSECREFMQNFQGDICSDCDSIELF